MAFEIWRGPSELDGVTDIVVLISGSSSNSKTGDQLQVWIMRADIPPHVAVKQKLDGPICGSCVHRCGSCYVLTHQAPRQVWKSWHRNPRPTPRGFINRFSSIRFGAYGDGAAVPYEVVHGVAQMTGSFTGFTHQWATCDPRFANLFMASVESFAEAREAQALGYRTYRTTTPDYHRAKGEISCPGSKEMGRKLTCAQCGYCNGNAKGFKGNVVVEAHGAPWKVNRFGQAMAFQQPQAPVETMGNQNEARITWL